MKKFVNMRQPVIAAFALAAGVAAGTAFAFYKTDFIFILSAVPVAAVIYIVLALAGRSSAVIMCVPIALVFFLIGAVGCRIYADNYLSNEFTQGNIYTVSGTVSYKGYSDYGEYIIIKNVNADGQAVGGKTRVYLGENYGDFCDVGYTVTFTSELRPCDLFTYGKVSYNSVIGIKYTAYVYGGLGSEYGFSFFGAVKNAVKSGIYGSLSSESAAVACAMLFGDDDAVESGTIQAFRYGGIAHIFAVSGLHIGIVYGIALGIMKLLRANKYISAILCLSTVVFYAGVCGFTLSSIRAAVMCAVSAVAKLTLNKYDGLNALALSVIIILLICPFNLFSAGFSLSVGAVCGILLLSKKIERLLAKIKIPHKAGAAAGVSIGAQAGVLPVMLSNFGYVSGAGLLLNIILVPVLSLFYAVLFIGSVISAAVPAAAAAIIPAAALPIQFITSFLVNAGFENALITGFGSGMFVPVYFIALFILSDKLNLAMAKRITCFICAAAVLVCYTLARTYLPVNGFSVTVSSQYGYSVIIKSASGTVLVVTENADANVASALSANYSSVLDGIIILGGENSSLTAEELGFGCAYYVYEANIVISGNADIFYANEFSLCGADFEFVDAYNLIAVCDGVTVGISAGQVTIDNCDLLVTAYVNMYCNATQTAGFTSEAAKLNAYDRGDLTFYAHGGKLSYSAFLPI